MKPPLMRYERKLSMERVPVYKDYDRKQIQMIRDWAANMSNSAFTMELICERYMKGYERKPDSFGALRQLYRILPYRTDPTNGVQVYQQCIICLSRLGDGAGRDAWENKLLADFKSDTDACAGVYYDRGTAKTIDSNPHSALRNVMKRRTISPVRSNLPGKRRRSIRTSPSARPAKNRGATARANVLPSLRRR